MSRKRGRPLRPARPPAAPDWKAATPPLPIDAEEGFERIAALFPSIRDRDDLRRDLRQISDWHSIAIYEEKRNKPKEVQRALKAVRASIEAAIAAFASAGFDTKIDISRQQRREIDEFFRRVAPSSRSSRGRVRLARAMKVLDEALASLSVDDFNLSLRDALASATRALEAVGHDGEQALRRCAGVSRGRETPDPGVDSVATEPARTNESPIYQASLVLPAMRDWAARAVVGVYIPGDIEPDPTSEDGDPEEVETVRQRRPVNVGAEAFMNDLIEIWIDQTGTRPTLTWDPYAGGRKTGRFIALCEAIMLPAYEAQDARRPSLQAVAQKLLNPQRDKPKSIFS